MDIRNRGKKLFTDLKKADNGSVISAAWDEVRGKEYHEI